MDNGYSHMGNDIQQENIFAEELENLIKRIIRVGNNVNHNRRFVNEKIAKGFFVFGFN